MRIEFTVFGLPVAQPRQRHRVVQMGGRAIATNYTPGNHPSRDFKVACQTAANVAAHGEDGPVPLLTGPLKLTLTFVFPRPKSAPKKQPGRLPKITKPDGDNLAKCVMDGLNHVVWHDDSQIYSLVVTKLVAAVDETPRTDVVIETL